MRAPLSLAELCTRAIAKHAEEFEYVGASDLVVECQTRENIRLQKILGVMHFLLNGGAIVFGGAVRDLLAQEIPRDLDVCFFSAQHRDEALRGLGDEPPRVEQAAVARGYGVRYTLVFTRDVPSLHLGPVCVEVDACIDLGQLQELAADLTVNSLLLSDTGVFSRPEVDFLDVLRQIQAHEFSAACHASVHTPRGARLLARRRAMQDRGWTWLKPARCPFEGCFCSSA